MKIDDVFTFLEANKNEIDLFFENIDFTTKDLDIIKNWQFCPHRTITFEKCSFDIDYKNAQELFECPLYLFYSHKKPTILNSGYKNYKNCSFTNNSFANNGIKKINRTPFSTNTSVYIKLGNKCNGKCSFCKNKSENTVATNTKNIINALTNEKLLSHLNQIYFGGGEPSLYLDQIENILIKYYNIIEEHHLNFPDWYIFTNGTGDWKRILEMIKKIDVYHKSHIIISRQEIEDEKNANIMGVNYSLDNQSLRHLIYNNQVSFALTCSKLNMRENFLQDYLKFGNEMGILNFIIQNLEFKTNDNVVNIEEYFKLFEAYLKEQNYVKTHIVSSSYFDLCLFKNHQYKSVALKRYFSPTKLEERLKYCPKHSFDLGIDANGEIYNDFQMIKKL